MKTRALAALALLVCALTAGPVAAGQPPVEAFGQLPQLEAPQLSPDGKHLAAIQEIDGKPAAVVYTIEPSGVKPRVFPSSGGWLVYSLQWAKSDRLILYLLQHRKLPGDFLRGWGRTIAISPDGSNPVVLFHDNPFLNNNTATTVIADLMPDDPTHIMMPLWIYDSTAADSDTQLGRYRQDKNYFRLDLYRVDVTTGHGENAMYGDTETVDWYLDGRGNVVGRKEETELPLQDTLKLYLNNEWQDAVTLDASGDLAGVRGAGLDSSGKSLVIAAFDLAGHRTYDTIDLATKAEKPLFSDPTYDIDEALADPWTGRIIGAAYSANKMEYHYFDPSWQALQLGLEKAFPGLTVHAVSNDTTKTRVIAAVSGPQHPLCYYFVDRTTHQATLFGQAYPGLHPEDLGDERPYNYTARDGLAIPAYITLPPGRAPKNLPAVVMPHGGPEARDNLDFDWWAQFLANRGYVVLQPNFRGSSGYGSRFVAAGHMQWGLKMQDDVTDGVKKMIADGIADPKRICIVGGSYGGYAAIAGAAFTPDLYACAVSVAGVSDLPKMLQGERSHAGRTSKTVAVWTSRIGSPYDDSDQLRATSPARHADQVKCPILLIHGDQDSTVPIVQSELMADALKSAGKQFEFVRLEGDDHYLGLGATRIQMLSETEKFLKAHIGS